MKKIKFIMLLSIAAILGSCSSDSSSSSSVTESFTYKIDGEVITVTSWEALRSEETIAVSGYGSNGKSISFEFNTNGDIGEVDTYSLTDLSVPPRNAQAYYTNESFTFNLISVNSSNKSVKVSFSGKVYENEYDLTSPSVDVEGAFTVNYEDVVPTVPGLGVFAKVAGADWFSSSSDQSGGFFSGSDITLSSYNGDIYSIDITSNHDDSIVGSYDFIPSSSTNMVTLSKYNTMTDSFDVYNCTGTLNMTTKTVGLQFTVISGTFTFTAVDPVTSASITVTNGTFTEAYTNY
jgi:hypothetical protein